MPDKAGKSFHAWPMNFTHRGCKQLTAHAAARKVPDFLPVFFGACVIEAQKSCTVILRNAGEIQIRFFKVGSFYEDEVKRIRYSRWHHDHAQNQPIVRQEWRATDRAS